MSERIYLSSPTMHGEELQFVKEAFDRNWVAPLGFNCDGFEDEMSAYIEANGGGKMHALALSAGTAALHLAVKLAGIGPGDIVLCSDMTFSATVNPISYEGGVQVFVDCDRETWNMDPRALEKAFEKYPNAKAVMLAHLYGTPAKMDEICEICEAHGAVLIEDAAEAVGASYKGRACGSFGKYGVYSFNGNKIITTSGGGMLLTHDKESRDKALFWATQAREKAPWYQHKELGYNYRMSNVVAGIGRGQLMHLDGHRALKEAIYHRYEDMLTGAGSPITMNPWLHDSKPNFWLSCMLIDRSSDTSFMDVLNALAAENIESRPIWKPMHMQPVFADRDFVYVEDSPVDEDIFSRGLCLPSDIKMSEETQAKVCEIVKAQF